MKYIGRMSGYGTLTWSGSGSCAVRYDLEGFYRDKGHVSQEPPHKVSGRVHGLAVAIDNMAASRDVLLTLEDGREVKVRVHPIDTEIHDGTLEIDVLTPIKEFTDYRASSKPRMRGGFQR